MKLFLISQEQNNGYDTYDSAVVAAPAAKVRWTDGFGPRRPKKG